LVAHKNGNLIMEEVSKKLDCFQMNKMFRNLLEYHQISGRRKTTEVFKLFVGILIKADTSFQKVKP